MHKSTFIMVLLATPVALALQPAARLIARQSGSCPIGWVTCGVDNCMPVGDTCCSDGSYCLATQYCDIGNNGLGGCCSIGKECTGNGGTAGSTFTQTFTSTNTNTNTIPVITTSSTPAGFTKTSTSSSTSSSVVVPPTTSTKSSKTTPTPTYSRSSSSNTTATTSSPPVAFTGAASPSSEVASGLFVFALIALGKFFV